jgi:hypothetical protein
MKRHLTSQQRQQAQEQLRAGLEAGHSTVLEFTAVEDMLRHDALHTTVPPHIEHRLAESAAGIAPPTRSWWRRLFGR